VLYCYIVGQHNCSNLIDKFMPKFTLTGEFDFNSTDISSSKGFNASLCINVSNATHDQHVYIKEQLAKKLNLRPHSTPTAWGENPIRYDEINFDTHTVDSTSANGLGTGDLSLIKHLIELLKEGRRSGFIDDKNLKCNGLRYPDNGDHPLFSKIPPLNEVPDALRNFESLNSTINQIIGEAQEKFPSEAVASDAKGHVHDDLKSKGLRGKKGNVQADR